MTASKHKKSTRPLQAVHNADTPANPRHQPVTTDKQGVHAGHGRVPTQTTWAAVTKASAGPCYHPRTIAILRHLSRRNAITANGIAKRLGVDLDKITTRLASMVKRATIARAQRTPKGTPTFRITDKGRAALEAIEQGRGNMTHRAFGAAVPTATAKPSAQPVPEAGASPKPEPYTAPELQPYQVRPGAMDAFKLPSRMFNRLHYRHGRVEEIE
jgi:DNA-binding MarR family transcriptional regulator